MYPYHYGVFCLNRKTEFDSCETPERFLEMAQKFHQLFGLELPDYEVWQNDGVWIPLHSGQDFAQTVLFPGALNSTRQEQNVEVIGRKLVDNYRRWRREIYRIEKHNARRESDSQRLGILKRHVEKVDWLMEFVKENEFHPDIDAGQLFKIIIVDKQLDTIAAKKINVSIATLYRLKKRLTRSLGYFGIQKLTPMELNVLLRE
ncbi:hypothetical protein LLE49_20095 [Alicyclobacillus tolerans]|uniref:hypothetical protein n=1 Tax=Alicyclobacillus tolerans TaxID=90970 RepID=UPI001F3D6549|nr:hypothetical protein [Alicyclobacillus tolerans]MCF8567026.1 hypothetical protein [Alicyclobacillus tolerans]